MTMFGFSFKDKEFMKGETWDTINRGPDVDGVSRTKEDWKVVGGGHGFTSIPGVSREFATGATRDTDVGKLDFEGFLSPRVLEAFAVYMNKNRVQSDGSTRDSDNWQKGIPKSAYMKSAFRHFFDWWKEHRGIPTKDGIESALCGLMFNVMGYLHEYLKDKEGDGG